MRRVVPTIIAAIDPFAYKSYEIFNLWFSYFIVRDVFRWLADVDLQVHEEYYRTNK
jgi:hypothetical protein